MLMGVKRAGAGHPALHFVKHEHQIMLVTQGTKPAHEFGRGRTNPAFALDRFDQEASGTGVDRCRRRFQIVELDDRETGQQGREAVAQLLLVGRR
jgi:hypothetical protein